jgi:hypothetical protein
MGIKHNRIDEAKTHFRDVQLRLTFWLMEARIHDCGRQWQFVHEELGHVASYWPGSAKLQIGNGEARDCGCVTRATELIVQYVQVVVLAGAPSALPVI